MYFKSWQNKMTRENKTQKNPVPPDLLLGSLFMQSGFDAFMLLVFCCPSLPSQEIVSRGTVRSSLEITSKHWLKVLIGPQPDLYFLESIRTMILTSLWILGNFWKHSWKNPVSMTMIFCNTANCVLQSLGTYYLEEGWICMRKVSGFDKGSQKK